jgi:hypothetical protein
MKRSSLALLLLLPLAACHKSEEPKKTDEKPAAAAETRDKKKTKPPPPPVDEGIDVPTEEDFEETASTQITEQSDLKKELDQLEKDIGK